MANNLDMHAYIVNVYSPETGTALRTLNANRVEAAYYKTEDGFTTFKNDRHQDVYTVRNDCLVTVERADTPVDQRAGAFLELLARADNAASEVTGVITHQESLPDGSTYNAEYQVRIKARGCVG